MLVAVYRVAHLLRLVAVLLEPGLQAGVGVGHEDRAAGRVEQNRVGRLRAEPRHAEELAPERSQRRAAQQAGLREIPALVKNVPDQAALAVADVPDGGRFAAKRVVYE